MRRGKRDREKKTVREAKRREVTRGERERGRERGEREREMGLIYCSVFPISYPIFFLCVIGLSFSVFVSHQITSQPNEKSKHTQDKTDKSKEIKTRQRKPYSVAERRVAVDTNTNLPLVRQLHILLLDVGEQHGDNAEKEMESWSRNLFENRLVGVDE